MRCNDINDIQEKQARTAEIKINRHGEYINDVFSCVKCLFLTERNPEAAFSEGSLPGIYSGSNRDIAILRNEEAELFSICKRYDDGLSVSKTE